MAMANEKHKFGYAQETFFLKQEVNSNNPGEGSQVNKTWSNIDFTQTWLIIFAQFLIRNSSKRERTFNFIKSSIPLTYNLRHAKHLK